MCGGGDTVKRVFFPRIFHKDVDPCPSILGVCPAVKLTGLASVKGEKSRECVWGR